MDRLLLYLFIIMIRWFEPDDLETLLRIWKDSNVEAHSFVPREYWEKNLPFVAQELPKAEVWVIEEGGIKGFAGLTGDYIAGIFVARLYRRRGLGGRLLSFLKERHERLSLHVYEKNGGALAFYLREGFTATERSVNPDTQETELLMEWKDALI